MSQKIPGDSGQKGFAVGRGLLAAAETLNFSMGDPGSGGMYGSASRPVGGMPRGGPGGGGLGAGGGGGLGQGPKDPQHDPQLSRRVGSHLGSTMKLFASLGLSPADLDELAQIPEDSISVETLPTLIMQLKNRKMDTGAGRRISDPHRDMSSALSQETSYRPGRDNWADMQDSHHHHHHHHLESSPMGHGSGRGNVAQGDFGYGSMQDMPPPLGGVGGGGGGGGYDSIDYGHGSGGGASIGGRERQYSELSHDSYRGLGMGTSMSMSTPDSMLMQRRMGSPSHGKVQDFMGAMPHMFPHVCSLCDFDVHSTMEWNQHTNGLRHSENCRLLLQMYPEWDPHMPSNRGAGLHSMDPSGRSDGLLGAAPQGGGMGSNWGSDTGGYGGYSNKQQTLAQHGKVRRGRVIVVKYDRKPQPTNSLFALAKPFGTVRENLVLKKKAFLELETHEEAKAMADFYQRKPAMVNGKEVQLYLSREIAVIDKTLQSDPLEQKGDRRSQVVFFSNLRRDMNKSQLLSVCQQFGTVEKHLFLAGEAFVQMKTPNDAEMLVKYYTLNPLSIKGKNIRLNICTKYKTLTVHQGRAGQGKQDGKGNNSGSKASSTRGQRSSSSRAKDASSDKADTSQDKNKEMEEEDEEEGAQGEEGSGDEVAGVMEGDEQEEEEEGGDEEQGDDDEDMEQDGAEESAEQQEANKADPEENAEEGGDANTCSAEVQGDGDEKGQEQSQEEEKGDGEGDQKEKEAASSQDEAAMEETAGADQEASTEAAKDPEAEEGPQDDSLPDDPSEDQCGEPDFPENMDDFVTLDELAEEEDGDRHDSKSRGRDSSGSSRKSGGLRVVNVVGFRRGINYLDEILSLAKPFGKVVRHLVLNVRPEAFLELSTEQEARSMVSFYNSNVTPSVCGKAVKIYHSQTYATIQSGKVIYVGQIPYFKTSDATLLKIAEPFGKIRRYYMNRSRNECFIEMENGEDAESMADAYKTNPPKFQGKRLTVYMSRKYKQLKHGHRPPSPEPEEKRAPKRERTTDEGKSSTSDSPSKPSSTTSSTTSSAAKKDEQQPPPAKKAKEDKKEAEQPQQQTPDETPTSETTQPPATGEATTNGTELKKETAENDVTPPDSVADQKTKIEEDVKQEELEPPVKSASVDAPKPEEATPSEAAEKRPEVTQLPLDPHDPSTPIGVEFVKMGYYCRVCFLFYSNEETAKKVHCSSKGHYEKLKKHLEKEKAKSQSSNSKN